MARASFAQRGRPFPRYLHEVDVRLRKFRQMIDELSDIEEDLRGGLVTLPILHVLTSSPEAVRRNVINYWQNNEQQDILNIHHLIDQSRTKEWVYTRAIELYDEAMQTLDASLGKRAEGYKRLFEYKRAKLEMLVGT